MKADSELELILQGYNITLASLSQEIKALRIDLEKKSRTENLPDWLTLREAVSLKGGPAYETYRTNYFLQPCCGRNSKIIGGRKCWSRQDVLAWLGITDSGLNEYAEKWKVTLPENYKRRSA